MSPDALPTECSRAGCRQTASWKVNWRNPRIHSTDRVKVWVACGEHVEFLRDYLASRGFPVAVCGIDESVESVAENAS